MRKRHLRSLALALLPVIALVLATTGRALAQPPVEPPPPQAIQCARFVNASTDLAAPAELTVTLDEDARKARLTISGVPEAATCYTIHKDPSGVNPVVFAWDEERIEVPAEQFDEWGFESAGRYCYSLFIGHPGGYVGPIERCIDVPTTIAPEPTPTPEAPTPGPPGVGAPTPQMPTLGTGMTGTSKGSSLPLAIAIGTVLSALGMAAFAFATRSKQ